MPAGCLVGIDRTNGAGKTTLLRLVTGQKKADFGDTRIGQTVKIPTWTRSGAT